MGLAPAPGANQGDVEFVARRVCAEQFDFGKNEASGPGESKGFEELAPFHKGSVSREEAGSQASALGMGFCLPGNQNQ